VTLGVPRRVIGFAVAVAALLAAAPASGHRLDEYLQAIRVDIGPERILIDVDLTPGASLAADVLATLDSNGDRAIGTDEEHAFLVAFLESLELSIDGEPRTLSPVNVHFPPSGDLLDGAGVISLALTADAVGVNGAHRLVVRTLYRPDVGVYLANALRPTAEGVTITAQSRDPKQQHLGIDYVVGIHLLTLTSWSASWGMIAAVLLGFAVWWRRGSRQSTPIG